jgi:transcriptional regulator with XRE-family HTH domain
MATLGATELRAERRNLGLSIEVAARRMGVGTMTLWRAEKGITRPHPDTGKRIADYYGRRVTDLWPEAADVVHPRSSAAPSGSGRSEGCAPDARQDGGA